MRTVASTTWAFVGDTAMVDNSVDGVPQERPVTIFSSPAHRPVTVS